MRSRVEKRGDREKPKVQATPYTLTAGKKTIDWDTFKSVLEKNGFPGRAIKKVERRKHPQKITYSVVAEGIGTVETAHEEKVRRPPSTIEEATFELRKKCKTDAQLSSLTKTLEELGCAEIEIKESKKVVWEKLRIPNKILIPLGIAQCIVFGRLVAGGGKEYDPFLIVTTGLASVAFVCGVFAEIMAEYTRRRRNKEQASQSPTSSVPSP